MDDRTKKLLEEALALPAEQRAAVAGSLIQSLEEQVDEDAEAAWGKEIQKRINEIDSGTVKTIPWFQARRMILGKPDAQA